MLSFLAHDDTQPLSITTAPNHNLETAASTEMIPASFSPSSDPSAGGLTLHISSLLPSSTLSSSQVPPSLHQVDKSDFVVAQSCP